MRVSSANNQMQGKQKWTSKVMFGFGICIKKPPGHLHPRSKQLGSSPNSVSIRFQLSAKSHSERQQLMAQGVGFLSSTWETQIVFLAPTTGP